MPGNYIKLMNRYSIWAQLLRERMHPR